MVNIIDHNLDYWRAVRTNYIWNRADFNVRRVQCRRMNNFKPRHWCETGWLCNKQSNCRNIYETYPMHQTWCQCRSQFFIYQSWQKWVNWDQIKLPLQLIKANLCRGSIKLDQSSCPDNFVEMSSLLIVRHFCQICHNPTHRTCHKCMPDITEVLQCETLDQGSPFTWKCREAMDIFHTGEGSTPFHRFWGCFSPL